MPWSIWILIGGVAALVVEEPSIVPMVVAQILVPALVIQQVGILPQPARISHQNGCCHGGATGHNYLGFAEVTPDRFNWSMFIHFPIAIIANMINLYTYNRLRWIPLLIYKIGVTWCDYVMLFATISRLSGWWFEPL